jgi:hypothetical protein
VVQRDPNSEATDQTISDEVAFGREVLGEYNRVAHMINQLEWDSKQAMDFKAMLTDLGDPDHLLEETVSLETKIISLEDKLFQIHVTSASIEEGISMPMKLYERMAALVEAVMHGNATGGGAGFAPTEAEIAVNKTYQQELAECQREFKQLTDKEVPAFNERVKQSHLVAAIAP